jgi:CDP-diacylglycerol--glycerol-3-phosphate 3-phosphatidyltransferase
MKLNLPNIFTLLRAALSPVFMALLLAGGSVCTVSAGVVFIAAAITDYIDGWLARKYGQSSAWGTMVDPLADKILTTAAFVSFALLDLIAWWMVALTLARDAATTAFRLYADGIGKPLVTSRSAKAKTFAQMTFIITTLVALAALEFPLPAPARAAAEWATLPAVLNAVMALVTAVTLWTGAEYFLDNGATLRRPCRKLLVRTGLFRFVYRTLKSAQAKKG